MAQPDLIPMPFAENATPGTIEPIEATTPTVPQDATWSTGFPQVTMQPLAAGGIPPRGQNFNGVLNALSRHIFHMQGGGQYKWDDAHGPYSIGDVLQSDDGLRSYVSVVDNNTDNFNTTPSAIGDTWLPWSGGAASELVAGLVKIATTAQAQALTDDATVITPKKLADAFSGGNQSLNENGYQKLPGGLILQWGLASASDLAHVTFPIAFPTACIHGSVTEGTALSNGPESVVLAGIAQDSYTTTGFQVRVVGLSGNPTNSGVTWIAIGH